jgi:hypothetical protein
MGSPMAKASAAAASSRAARGCICERSSSSATMPPVARNGASERGSVSTKPSFHCTMRRSPGAIHQNASVPTIPAVRSVR